MKKMFAVLIVTIIVVACEKEYVIWKKDYVIGDFSGVIATDEYGNYQRILGEDDGDWHLTDVFNEKAEGLFLSNFVTISNFVQANDYDSPSPNPSIGVLGTITEQYLSIYFNSGQSGEYQIKMVLVDSEYQPLLNYEISSCTLPKKVTIDLKALNILQFDMIYRVYYKMIIGNVTTLCGHGDIIFTDDALKYNSKPYI